MKEIAPFTLRGRNPDVLTCIANLSNDEVFTPPEFANRMLDTLAEAWAASNQGANIWADKTLKFLDPFTKSGVFLREITSRLNKGLAQQIPDLQERVDHILTQQVFGIGITHLTSLLAGASEGIGAAFSHHLAAEGMGLVLVARRKEPLDVLAATLTQRYGIQTTVITCDLSASDAAQQLQTALAGREINLLVYNAAIPYIGRFEDDSIAHHNQIAQANMVTPMNLCHIFGSAMLKRGKGAIVMMASLAGFQGSGFLTAYASSKAFDRVLAESLWYEWKDRGVDVIACCAGATATPNYLNSKPAKTSAFAPKVQAPEDVVRECIKQLGKRPSYITGRGNRIASFFMQRLMPRKMAIKIMGDTTRKMYMGN